MEILNKESKNFINKIKNINPNIKIFTGRYIPKDFSKLKKKKFLIFSGIGNPHTFSDTLKSLKIKFSIMKNFLIIIIIKNQIYKN